MFYYYLKKFSIWTLALLVLLEVVLAGAFYLSSFLNYEPLPFRLLLVVFALQAPDSLRFACSMAALCLAASAVGGGQIVLIRTTVGKSRAFLEPFMVASVACACFCMFFDNYARPALEGILFAGERKALTRGLKTGIARTGSFRIGRAAFTASSIDGEAMLRPFCAVGSLLIRGERCTAGDDEVEISNADLIDVHAGKTFHAGTFRILFPFQPPSLSGPALWIRRPWRGYRSVCLAVSVIPLTFLGLVAGLASGRLGQLRCFLLWLVLTFGIYLGLEKALLDLARHTLPVATGWVVYLWAFVCGVAACFAARKMFHCRFALGLEA